MCKKNRTPNNRYYFIKKHYSSPVTCYFSIKFTFSFSVYWVFAILLGTRCTEINKTQSLTTVTEHKGLTTERGPETRNRQLP